MTVLLWVAGYFFIGAVFAGIALAIENAQSREPEVLGEITCWMLIPMWAPFLAMLVVCVPPILLMFAVYHLARWLGLKEKS